MPSNKSALFLGLVATLLFLALNLLGSKLLVGVRADLTEDKLNTLSEGAREIARTLSEPVDLSLYYSRSTGNDLPTFKSHAQRTIDMLEELERESDGKLRLTLLDPEPYSDAEDEAVLAGLRGRPVNDVGDSFYLGLVAENSVGERKVLPLLDPRQERFLEYELARMLKTLDQPTRPTLGLVSSLPINGGAMAAPGEPPTRPWLFPQLLSDLFDLEDLGPDPQSIPEDVDVLLLLHPQGMSETALYAIDQFALGSGRVIALVDTWCDEQLPGTEEQTYEMNRTSDLGPLLAKWGVQLRPRILAADRRLALQVEVRNSNGQVEPLDLPLYMAAGLDQMDEASPVTASLSRMVFAYAGVLDAVGNAGTELVPLITTTEESMGIELSRVQFGLDPRALVNDFAPEGEELVLAARLTGKVQSAYPRGDPSAPAPADGEEPTPGPDHLAESTGNFEAIVVADADFLSDAYWTSQDVRAALLGTVTLTAANADFVLNAAELLSGDDALISIRARGQYERPFERVQELERDANVRFRAEAQLLEEELLATENSIDQMQRERGDSNSMLLTEQQAATLEEFQQKRIATRKQLRDVELKLRKDKERMWTRLKLINIAIWPLAVGLAAFSFGAVRRSRQRTAKR